MADTSAETTSAETTSADTSAETSAETLAETELPRVEVETGGDGARLVLCSLKNCKIQCTQIAKESHILCCTHSSVSVHP